MEFLEALSPTLLILVIIKHSQLNLSLKIHFKRQKKPKSFMKNIFNFRSMLCMHFADFFLSYYPHVLNLFKCLAFFVSNQKVLY